MKPPVGMGNGWIVHYDRPTRRDHALKAQMEQWCRDNIEARFGISSTSIYFDNTEDANLFYLTWKR